MNVVECTIPPDMTIERWRRLRRSAAPTQRDPCDHLHDTVSRYDHAANRLGLLLTCPVCETEKVIHSLAYDAACELPIAAATIPIDRTAHGAMSC